MNETTFTREDLVDKYGFQEISDESGTDYEYVIDTDNWAKSDYFLASEVATGLYVVNLLTTDGTVISESIKRNILNRDILGEK